MTSRWIESHDTLGWGQRIRLMGIVNVTPDSFSDGGRFFDPQKAIEHAYRLFDEGADIVDIGGESTRPGAEPVPVDEELRRVIPVIEEVAGRGGRLLSIDTTKYETAARALEAGARVLNDISGLQKEPRLAELAASFGVGLVLMHSRGNPQTMQSLTHYTDLLDDIRVFFQQQIQIALDAGVPRDGIALDPGIGFGKTAEQNLSILKNLERIRIDDYPLLLGVSRKSFIGKITDAEVDRRLMGTAGAVAASIINGADVVRVHDVEAMRDTIAVAHAIRTVSLPENGREVRSSVHSG